CCFFSSRRRHTRSKRDWSSDVCSSDLDTITSAKNPTDKALPGYRRMNPMVFCGMYPVDANRYNDLREALERLELNDSSLRYEAEIGRASCRERVRIWVGGDGEVIESRY